MKSDTICAIATPIGTGGVGIIRISGEDSVKIACKLFITAEGKRADSFIATKLYFGKLNTGSFVDNCLCVYFKAPNSFTGEEVIEFQCHGGVALLNSVLKAVIDKGARLAECGEFTKRAFINGKLDLCECEGLIDIINAESEAGIMAASSLLGGELSNKIKVIQDELKQLLSYAEVSIDYSDENIEQKDKDSIVKVLNQVKKELELLAKGYNTGNYIKEGVTIALCGKPNAGKSSLFNALLGFDRAIVTDIAGTTRDALEGQYSFNGVLFKIYDTAGIHQSSGLIESKGIELSKKYIEMSDAVVFLTENEILAEDEDIIELLKGKKSIKVKSKSDKSEKADNKVFDLTVSALTGKNIEKLKQLLYDKLIGQVYSGGLILTNFRHYDAVSRCIKTIDDCIANLNNMYADMMAYDIKTAWEILGEITGESSIESVIDNIFSRFCLGK